jgi:hypothetical protein
VKEWPRFRQSIAKDLVTKSPEHVRQIIEGEMKRKESKQMRRGSLVDQLVFGGANYQVVDAKLKSGPRKGQPADDWMGTEAKEQRAEIISRGMLPVLPCELEKAQVVAGRVKSILLEADFAPERCRSQHTLQWTTGLGVEAEGIPDFYHVLSYGRELYDPQRYHADREHDRTKPDELGNTPPVRVDSFDLKVVESCNPDWLDSHVADMGWDIQGSAYQEAVHANWSTVQQRGNHYILAVEAESLVAVLCPLSEAYLEFGSIRWQRAQRIWQECIETNTWRGYKSRPLVPPMWRIERESKHV